MISGITAGLTDPQISRQTAIAGSLEPHGTIQSHDGSMVLLQSAIYGNMDPINIPHSC